MYSHMKDTICIYFNKKDKNLNIVKDKVVDSLDKTSFVKNKTVLCLT